MITMSSLACCDPYYTEYTCKDTCIKCCPDTCYSCCRKYYSHIVMVFAIAMSIFGIVDLILGGKLAIVCPENDALYSSLMLAQGVISMIEGVMIFYSIGRVHDYSLFRSGLPTFQYAFVTYALTSFFYITSLTLSGVQVAATGGGMAKTNCSDYHGYIVWRFVFNILVPVSPIALVLSIVAIGIACTILLACLSGAERTENRNN
ncbi:uncharacterized protein LOC128156336 [Crassostrea angulata]|uniref:uncharacterized protein LOC128156336 n=1 Tax=Magallana angulata TaxID=2784310 RepID=UPI0022B177B2|nr:uncharacterized protein LOC128156336 [Crassostrea angulata]